MTALPRFAVSIKHHLRSELGIYYEDLYHLIQPLHEVSTIKLHDYAAYLPLLA
jgi:hypothetical protein